MNMPAIKHKKRLTPKRDTHTWYDQRALVDVKYSSQARMTEMSPFNRQQDILNRDRAKYRGHDPSF